MMGRVSVSSAFEPREGGQRTAGAARAGGAGAIALAAGHVDCVWVVGKGVGLVRCVGLED